jgi:hypothetical protein
MRASKRVVSRALHGPAIRTLGFRHHIEIRPSELHYHSLRPDPRRKKVRVTHTIDSAIQDRLSPFVRALAEEAGTGAGAVGSQLVRVHAKDGAAVVEPLLAHALHEKVQRLRIYSTRRSLTRDNRPFCKTKETA